MSQQPDCALGRTPNIPNWQPAETASEYLRNCAEGLETYTETRMIKLLGFNRKQAWRAKMMSHIPDDLFDALLAAFKRKPSTRVLAAVGRFFAGGQPSAEIERCPHCGHVLRVRSPWPKEIADAVTTWLSTKDTHNNRSDQ